MTASRLFERVEEQHRDFAREALRLLPSERIYAIYQSLGEDGSFNDYVDAIDCVMAEVGQLSALDVAMLLLRSTGISPEKMMEVGAERFKQHQSEIAKKPRNRALAVDGGKRLVGLVQVTSKKRVWNTAWGWLCQQAENKATIGDFSLDGVDEVTNGVAYRLTHGGKTKTIKRETFRKYWPKKADR